MTTLRKNLASIGALTLLIFALTAPAGLAQSSRDGYVQQGPAVLDQVGGGGGNDPSAGASDSGQLPFTGLDVGLVAIAGASLLLMGAAMRRLTRAPDSA